MIDQWLTIGENPALTHCEAHLPANIATFSSWLAEGGIVIASGGDLC
jgi:hypothetical protein